MKKGKAKLLSDTDIKNCIRYIDEEMGSNSSRNRLMFYFMLMTALRIHSIQKLTIGQVYKENYIPVDSFLDSFEDCYNTISYGRYKNHHLLTKIIHKIFTLFFNIV